MGEKEVAEFQEDENPPEQSSHLHKSPTGKLLDYDADNTHHQESSDQEQEENESLKERQERRKKRRKERRAEMVVCEICGKNVRRHYKMVHMKSHTGEKPYKCEFCGNSFRQKQTLQNHRVSCVNKSSPKDKYAMCTFCGKSMLRESMAYHERSHTGHRPHACEVCGKTFIDKRSLKSHMFMHTGVKAFKCDICNKKFARASALSYHKKKHLGKTDVCQCDFCGKQFSHRGNMLRHRREHNGNKPHKCRFCDQAFAERYSLVRHERIHTGEKPYKCDQCGAAFNQKGNLVTHLSSHAGRKLSGTNMGSSHNRSFTNSKLLNEQYKISDQMLDLENLKKISERVENIKNDQNPEQESQDDNHKVKYSVITPNPNYNAPNTQNITFQQDSKVSIPPIEKTSISENFASPPISDNKESLVEQITATQTQFCQSQTEMKSVNELETSVSVQSPLPPKLETDSLPDQFSAGEESFGLENVPLDDHFPDLESKGFDDDLSYPFDETYLKKDLRKKKKKKKAKSKPKLDDTKNFQDTYNLEDDVKIEIPESPSYNFTVETFPDDNYDNFGEYCDIKPVVKLEIDDFENGEHDTSFDSCFEQNSTSKSNVKLELPGSENCDYDLQYEGTRMKCDLKAEMGESGEGLDPSVIIKKENASVQKSFKSEVFDSGEEKEDFAMDERMIKLEERESLLDEDFVPPKPKKKSKKKSSSSQKSDLSEPKQKGRVKKEKNDNYVICEICGKQVKEAYKKRHVRKHANLKPHTCDLCDKAFSEKSSLKMHIRVTHEHPKPRKEKHFVCEVCGKTVLREAKKRHMFMHSGERPYGCEICGRKFRWKRIRDMHYTVHRDEMPFSCDICGKKFKRQKTLQGHIERHLDTVKFPCDKCDKVFNVKSNLNRHKLTHEGMQHHCPHCEQSFVDTYGLRRHMRIHSGVRPWSCSMCGKSFTQKGNLVTHFKTHRNEMDMRWMNMEEHEKMKFLEPYIVKDDTKLTPPRHADENDESSSHFMSTNTSVGVVENSDFMSVYKAEKIVHDQ